MHSEDASISRALRAGARGYLLKESADADLIRAVDRRRGGRVVLQPRRRERDARRLRASPGRQGASAIASSHCRSASAKSFSSWPRATATRRSRSSSASARRRSKPTARIFSRSSICTARRSSCSMPSGGESSPRKLGQLRICDLRLGIALRIEVNCGWPIENLQSSIRNRSIVDAIPQSQIADPQFSVHEKPRAHPKVSPGRV